MNKTTELLGKAAYNSPDTVPQGNGTENAVLRVPELEERLDREIDELTVKRREIERAVNAVPDEVWREILTRRYLLYRKWDIIAEEMNYSERQVFRIHGAALRAFERCQ